MGEQHSYRITSHAETKKKVKTRRKLYVVLLQTLFIVMCDNKNNEEGDNWE